MTRDFSVNKIFSVLLRHIKLIILITIVGTMLAFCYTKFFIKPVYSASAIILVQNYDSSQDKQEATDPNQRVYSSDLSSSATLAEHCTVLFLNSPEMIEVLNGCSLDISSENETNFLRLSVSSTDPQTAADVCQKVTETAPKLFLEVYKAGKIDTIRPPSVPTAPSSPNVKQNVLIGFLGGLGFAILLSLFLDIIDTTIKPDDDLFRIYGIPVFAEIVDFEREE